MAFFNFKTLDFLEEPSVLNASDLVAWKRERGVYNFKKLPKKAIISIKKNVFFKTTSKFTKKAKGISGHHYIYKSKVLLCSEFGSGASAMIMLLEELKALGVEQFIFIGSAGILHDSVEEGSAYIISKVFSSSGASFYYSKSEEIDYYDQALFEDIKKKCNLDSKIAWSTDCPFRETPSLLDYYKSKTCALVEMESAAVYAFSQYYKMPSVCILIGADSLTTLQWKVPNDMRLILKVQQKLVVQLLKL